MMRSAPLPCARHLLGFLTCALGLGLIGPLGSVGADVITDWNTMWLDCVRATGGPPCPIARAGAMVHAAVYDAVNAIDQTHEPYLVRVRARPEWPMEAAAAVAAHDVLVHLYPARRPLLDAALDASLAQVPGSYNKIAAIKLGHNVARQIIHHRARDGWDDDTPYVPGTAPGDWRPTYPDYSPPATPNWGLVTPWTMIQGDQFRPDGPLGLGMGEMSPILTSAGYAEMFNEVKDLGARVSPTRTPYQTETAYFWANDVDGTYKPPGQLNHIAQVLAEQEGLDLPERARLFALLNIALGDAGIVAWDCKYMTSMDFWRPIAGIREADTDGNPLTVADPSWEPLNAFTPPFPAYTSGHATFGAAAAAIFANYFGTDHITYTIGTDEPLYTGGPRTYTTFSEAAIENARSRIYLGVHWQFDADDGNATGTALGNHVFATILRPVGEQAAVPAKPAALEDEKALAVAKAAAAGGMAVHAARAGSPPVIEYRLPAAGHLTVVIYDALGRRVETLVDRHEPIGTQRIAWHGGRAQGGRAGSGIYFARVSAPGWERAEKIVILK